MVTKLIEMHVQMFVLLDEIQKIRFVETESQKLLIIIDLWRNVMIEIQIVIMLVQTTVQSLIHLNHENYLYQQLQIVR